MPNEIEEAADLLELSYAAGLLSDESAGALAALPQIAGEVAQALGINATGSDVLLVTILVDDSESIPMIARGIQAEEQGHDRLLDVLDRRAYTQSLVHTRVLNGGSFSAYRPLADARRLSPDQLRISEGGTPLYLQSVLTLGSVIAKARQQADQGRNVRTFTLIITDGEDNASGAVTARHVQFIVRDMLDFASNHIVAGMGIGEHFAPTFRAMGIPERFIRSAGATAEDIDRLFDEFSETLALAAESEASFLQLTSGLDS